MSKRANGRVVIGTRSEAGQYYEGVLRDGKAIIAVCGHPHRNRDQSTGTNGRSARDCITNLARCARNPEMAKEEASAIRRSMEGYIRRFGTSAGQAERFRAAAEQGADAFLASLPAFAAAMGDRPVYGAAGQLEVPPGRPDPVPCGFCGTLVQPVRYGPKGWCDYRDAVTLGAWCGGSVHQPAENNRENLA